MQITTPREEIQSRSWKLWGFFCSVPKECVCLEAEGLEYCAQRCKSWLLSYEEMKGNELPQEHPFAPQPSRRGGCCHLPGRERRQAGPPAKGGAEQRVPRPLPAQDQPGCRHGSQQGCQKP